MEYVCPDLVKRVEKRRREEAMNQAECWRLLRRTGIDRRGWLSIQVCRLLCQLGRLLITLGRRLESYGSPSPDRSRSEPSTVPA